MWVSEKLVEVVTIFVVEVRETLRLLLLTKLSCYGAKKSYMAIFLYLFHKRIYLFMTTSYYTLEGTEQLIDLYLKGHISLIFNQIGIKFCHLIVLRVASRH